MTVDVPRLARSVADLTSLGPAAVTMGVFDGVHRGHQRVLSATRSSATEHGLRSVALVFDPPPVELLQAGLVVPRLAPLATNLELIEAAGIDEAIPLRFDGALRALRAEEFLAALAPAIELRDLVMTPQSTFGRGRGGTLDSMGKLAAERGFEVVAVDRLLIGGEPVSSTRIRHAVAAAELDEATELLSRPPFLVGIVVAGDRRGRELGFPTANLAFDYRPAMPPLGIYVGSVSVPARQVGPAHPALISIGVRPTFHDEGRVLVEVYLLDYDGDLYGARLGVHLRTRLRAERRFDGAQALIEQMRRDEAQARVYLGIGG